MNMMDLVRFGIAREGWSQGRGWGRYFINMALLALAHSLKDHLLRSKLGTDLGCDVIWGTTQCSFPLTVKVKPGS